MSEAPLIKLSFIYSEEHFCRLLSAERSRPGQLAFRAAAFLLFVGIVVYGPDALTLPILLVMVSLGFFTRWRGAKKAFEQLPWRNQSQNWLIGPDELAVTCEAFSATMKWSNFRTVEEFGDGFLLQLKTGQFYWFPRSAFHSDSDVQSFHATCESNGFRARKRHVA